MTTFIPAGRTLTAVVATMLLAVVTNGSAHAQQEIVDQFEKRSHTHEGLTLPYRLFVPEGYDPASPYPLVLALHGAGERGTDNERQIALHRLATSWADPVNQARHPSFVVAPQVPPDRRWSAEAPVDESDFIDVQRVTLAILDSLQSEFNIDPERLYITGLSMGGHGTWDFISRLPGRFAAAVPMSGNADPTQAAKLMHMPIWAFHGESDTVVRPFSSRTLIQDMEDLGRDVVYTDCRRSPVFATNFDCPDPMSNAELSEAIGRRADLIFTSLRNGGHGPWTVWYDHPLLADWLFSKQRVNPEAIVVDDPVRGDVLTGAHDVRWTANGLASDSVEVWLSLGSGDWQEQGTVQLSGSAFTFETVAHPDAGYARLRLVAVNDSGRVFGRVISEPFRIDNEGDGAPYLFLDDESLRFDPDVTAQSIDLPVVVADPEGGALTVEVYYSADGGRSYARVGSSELSTSLDVQSVTVDLSGLPNATEAVIRIDAGDGAGLISAATSAFLKRTPRTVNDYVEHVSGDGTGTITLHFIEPENLTGHRYRLTIDDADPDAKLYAVDDVTQGSRVLQDVPLSDGVLESPLFDGVRLVVQDLAVGGPDLEKTGWIAGDTDLSVTVNGGSVLIAILRVQLLETETEYELTVSDTVADTSVAGFGMPAIPLYFQVAGRMDGAQRDLLFNDRARDGRLGDRDVLYILEPDEDGEPAPAWELRFAADSGTVPPEAGDTFLFVPLSKLSSDDVFEFVALEGVSVEDLHTPDESILLDVYPNPFADSVTIGYRLEERSHVRLEIYDLLGRRVAVLENDVRASGDRRTVWNGGWGGGLKAASGVYVVLLSLTPEGGQTREAIRRTVTLVR